MNIQIQNFRSIKSLNQQFKMNDFNIVQNSDVLEAMAIAFSRSLQYLSSAYQRFNQQGRGFNDGDNNASITIQLNDITWTCSGGANEKGDEKQLAQYCKSFIKSKTSPLFIYYDKDFFESEIKIDTKFDDGNSYAYPTTAMKNALSNNTKSQIATWFWHRENAELRSKQPDQILNYIRQFCKNIYINSNNEFVVVSPDNNVKTLLSELPINEQNTILITMDLIRRAMIAKTNNKNMIVLIDNFKEHSLAESITKNLAKDMTFITC